MNRFGQVSVRVLPNAAGLDRQTPEHTNESTIDFFAGFKGEG